MRVPPVVAFVLCTFIWGTTWLAIKIGYSGLDAIWGAALRFLLAGVLLLFLMGARRLPLPRDPRHLYLILFVGALLFGLDYGLIYWGEQQLDSGLTAILFATMPLFVALFAGVLIPHERMSLNHVAGLCLGFLGLIVIFGPGLNAGLDDLAPSLAIVASAAAAAVSGVAVRRWGRELPPITLNAGAMLVGASLLTGASLLIGERPALPTTTDAWASLLYLVVFGSIISFLLYWDLLRKWTAHRAGLIPIATPVVAITAGYIVGEQLTLLQWLGSAIVLSGVALSLLKFQPKDATSATAAEAP